MTKYFKQVEGLPAKKGQYMTDHGYLKFDGKTFLIPMGRYASPVPTTISWYLEELPTYIGSIIDNAGAAKQAVREVV